MRFVDLAKVEAAAKSIEDVCGSYLKEQERMGKLETEMKEYFQMNAADEFYNKYPKLDEAMTKMKLCMKAYKDALESYVDAACKN